jgi:hydroxypyruvate isomerase
VKRRDFFSVAAAAVAGGTAGRLRSPVAAAERVARERGYSLKFAPHFGMFKGLAGKNLEDQLRFAADQGFMAWEDNEMKVRPVERQKRIAATMEKLGMQMGVISALRGVWGAVSFGSGDAAVRDRVLGAMREIIDVARRVNAKFLTVVPGMADPKAPTDYQTAACAQLLKRCCDVVEPHGLVMVIEPLNRQKNHPGVFLRSVPQGYLICKAVGRPACKILCDLYHQQISGGNLIPTIDACWSEIAYFQSGDTPGRHEPGTGEINYRNVLQHIYDKGYRGIVGMEHGNSKRGPEGERAVIEAYRHVNPR